MRQLQLSFMFSFSNAADFLLHFRVCLFPVKACCIILAVQQVIAFAHSSWKAFLDANNLKFCNSLYDLVLQFIVLTLFCTYVLPIGRPDESLGVPKFAHASSVSTYPKNPLSTKVRVVFEFLFILMFVTMISLSTKVRVVFWISIYSYVCYYD